MTAAKTTSAAVLLAVGVCAAACSSSASSGPTSTPALTSTASTPTTATVTRTETAAPSTVTTSPSGPSSGPSSTARDADPSGCATSQLRLTEGVDNGAGGTSYRNFYLQNTGTTRCTLFGYPGFSGVDDEGRVVQHPARRNRELNNNTPERTVALAPGDRAAFLVSSLSNVPARDCPKLFPVARVQVYPPNQRQALLSRTRFTGICDLQVGWVTQP